MGMEKEVWRGKKGRERGKGQGERRKCGGRWEARVGKKGEKRTGRRAEGRKTNPQLKQHCSYENASAKKMLYILFIFTPSLSEKHII